MTVNWTSPPPTRSAALPVRANEWFQWVVVTVLVTMTLMVGWQAWQWQARLMIREDVRAPLADEAPGIWLDEGEGGGGE